MAGRVVLHIGAMKTGTSYLQSVLGSNQELLSEAGCVFLGGKFGLQARAVRDVLNLPKAPKRNRERWAAIAEEAHQLDGRTGIVSMEFLGFAARRHVDAFLAPLEGLEVEVVMSVRDQFRAIPAQWQTYTRNFGTDDWTSYLRNIEPLRRGDRRRSRAFRTFHRAQDVLPVLDRWDASPLVSRTKVVTVPAPGAPREELWHRFRAATGIPDVAVNVLDVHDNASLGYGSCDYLRRANAFLQDVQPRRYRKGIGTMAREVLHPRRGEESRPELDRRGARFARSLNEQIRDGLSDGRYQLWGSLDDLPVPDDLKNHPKLAPPAPEAEVMAAARTVWERVSAGREGTRRTPDTLDGMVSESVAMLRAVNGWGEQR